MGEALMKAASQYVKCKLMKFELAAAMCDGIQYGVSLLFFFFLLTVLLARISKAESAGEDGKEQNNKIGELSR